MSAKIFGVALFDILEQEFYDPLGSSKVILVPIEDLAGDEFRRISTNKPVFAESDTNRCTASSS